MNGRSTIATIASRSLTVLNRNRRSLVASFTTTLVLSSSSVASSSVMPPSRPLQYQRSSVLDLTAFNAQVALAEKKRQDAYDVSRTLQTTVFKARASLETEDKDTAAKAIQGVGDMILESFPATANRTPREANLSNRMEEYVRLVAYEYFLETGRLLPPSKCSYATDEEYLAGACMELARDLSRYGMGRATERDVASVKTARDLVSAIMDVLLQFDFRNGYLRRKYDGTKYQLKALETLLYELSVTGSRVEEEDSSREPEAKRLRLEGLIAEEEVDSLRKRMEHRDELRETLIKKCRDGQKAAKQSIFALHRGDRKKAASLLLDCEKYITEDLLPIVKEEPPLHLGSFSNVMEEYAEGKMFYAWLFGKDDGVESPKGDLLLPEDFTIHLEPAEYLGGLCDCTGEIGRYAVQRGTARDIDAVKLCLASNASILNTMQSMERLPGNISKKMDMLRRSVEKLERMLYELSLSEATGRNMKSDMDMTADETTKDV